MGEEDVVRRELRFDVRDGNVTADANQKALGYLRNPQFPIDHRKVVAVAIILAVELPARETIGIRVAVVLSIKERKAHAPIDVVRLDGVGKTIEIQHGLIEFERFGLTVYAMGALPNFL